MQENIHFPFGILILGSEINQLQHAEFISEIDK